MEFSERTIKIIIDEDKCEGCETHACVEACKTFSRGILVLKDGKPAVEGSAENWPEKERSVWPVSTHAGLRGILPLPSRYPLRAWLSTEQNMVLHSRG